MLDQKAMDRINEELEKTKASISKGPWSEEPNRKEFKHAGFDCLVQRAPLTYSWCGYVGIPKNHPVANKDWYDMGLRVHGDVTYSSECSGHICHVTEDEDILFWIGFDCGHSGDLSPGLHCRTDMPTMSATLRFLGDNYRNINYVIAETKYLADQLRVKA